MTSKLAEAIEGGPLDARIADAKLHKMERGDFAPEFPLEWALKDVDLAIGAAGDDELPLLAALSRQWRAAVDGPRPGRRQRRPPSARQGKLLGGSASRVIEMSYSDRGNENSTDGQLWGGGSGWVRNFLGGRQAASARCAGAGRVGRRR